MNDNKILFIENVYNIKSTEVKQRLDAYSREILGPIRLYTLLIPLTKQEKRLVKTDTCIDILKVEWANRYSPLKKTKNIFPLDRILTNGANGDIINRYRLFRKERTNECFTVDDIDVSEFVEYNDEREITTVDLDEEKCEKVLINNIVEGRYEGYTKEVLDFVKRSRGEYYFDRLYSKSEIANFSTFGLDYILFCMFAYLRRNMWENWEYVASVSLFTREQEQAEIQKRLNYEKKQLYKIADYLGINRDSEIVKKIENVQQNFPKELSESIN